MDEPVPAEETGKRQKLLTWTVVAIVLVGAVIYVVKYARSVPRGQDVDVITGFNGHPGLLPASQKDIGIVLATNYHEFRDNSSNWSGVYYTCLFLSAFLSAMAALILKLEYFPPRTLEAKKDTAALCATIAAVLITLSTVGNFQQKWQANRLAATAMQNLVYEVWAKGAGCESKTDIYARIEEINLLRNQEIVGGNPPSQQPKKETQQAGQTPPVNDQVTSQPKKETPEAGQKPQAKDQASEPAKASKPDNVH